jgi:hypothetical protein
MDKVKARTLKPRVKRRKKSKRIIEFIEYVKSLSEPTYFLTIERPRIETYEEVEEDYHG